jgi:hypothetical protein
LGIKFLAFLSPGETSISLKTHFFDNNYLTFNELHGPDNTLLQLNFPQKIYFQCPQEKMMMEENVYNNNKGRYRMMEGKTNMNN